MKLPLSSGKLKSPNLPSLGKIAPYLHERPDFGLKKKSGHALDIVKRVPDKLTSQSVHLTTHAKNHLRTIQIPRTHAEERDVGVTITNRRRWPIIIRRVQGHSMVPVLPPGTMVWGVRWFRQLKPGDVVVFERDQKEMIKRIESISHGRVFVLGDHTDTSTDSRHFGTIHESTIIAKVKWPQTRPEAIS